MSSAKHILKIVKILAIKCLDPDPNLRPTIEWIMVILKELLEIYDKLF